MEPRGSPEAAPGAPGSSKMTPWELQNGSRGLQNVPSEVCSWPRELRPGEKKRRLRAKRREFSLQESHTTVARNASRSQEKMASVFPPGESMGPD